MTNQVLLISLPGHSRLERVLIAEIFSLARELGAPLSIRDGAIQNSQDLLWLADSLHCNGVKAVFICGKSEPDGQYGELSYAAVKAISHRCQDLLLAGANGAATELLAWQGLMQGKRAAARQEHVQLLRQTYPSVTWESSQSWLMDGRTITCKGQLSCLDMAFRVLQMLCPSPLAEQVADRLGLSIVRKGARSNPLAMHDKATMRHPALHRVEQLLGKEQSRSWTSTELAAAAFVSERHLQRLFKAQMGCKVQDYLATIRLDRAEIMIREYPYVSLQRIAEQCGFTSQQQLRRSWRKLHGVTPSELRAMQSEARAT